MTVWKREVMAKVECQLHQFIPPKCSLNPNILSALPHPLKIQQRQWHCTLLNKPRVRLRTLLEALPICWAQLGLHGRQRRGRKSSRKFCVWTKAQPEALLIFLSALKTAKWNRGKNIWNREQQQWHMIPLDKPCLWPRALS